MSREVFREIHIAAEVAKAPVYQDGQWRPNYSYQFQNERNCGQHCIRMITGLPIEFISRYIGTNKGTNPYDVCSTLWTLGYECDKNWSRYVSGMTLPKLCIIHTKGHWSLYYDGYFYCSNRGIFPMVGNKCGNRRILHYIRVEIPKVNN